MVEETLKLTLKLKEVPVLLEGEDGRERKCALMELVGSDRNEYLNLLTNRVKTSKDGKNIGIKSFDGFQSDLLTRCFYDEDGELFEKDEIEKMPSSTQQALFEKASELSDLNQEGKDDEKND